MASTNYPGSLDAYPVPNNGDTISVADHWLGPAVIGIETELGTDPAGSFTDVKSRLDDTDGKVITEADRWYLTTGFTNSGITTLSTNLLRWTTQKGTGMSQSSGIFTFPSTGYYLISFNVTSLTQATASYYVGGYISTTENNGSSWGDNTVQITAARNNGDYVSTSGSTIFRVVDTATHKVRFLVQSTNNAQVNSGASTSMQFLKVGDL